MGVGCFLLGWLGIPRGLEGSRSAPDLRSFPLHGPIAAIVPVRQEEPGAGASEILYVGASHGLYVSADQGLHWKRIFNSGFWDWIRVVAQDPADSRSLMVAAGSGLFSSSDGGVRWRRLLRTRVPILCIARDSKRPNRILVGTMEGLQISEDRGSTWVHLRGGLPTGPVRSIVVHPTWPDCYYVLADGGLFRSSGGTAAWDRVRVLVRAESDPPEADAKWEESEISEEIQDEGFLELGDLVVEARSGSLFLGTRAGIFVSRDEGASWLPLPSVGFGTPRITQLLLGPSGAGSLYAATEAGLFHLPLGTVWAPLRQGLPAGPIRAVAFGLEGKHLWVGTPNGLYQIPAPETLPLEPAVPRVFPPVALQEPLIQEVQQAAIRYAEVMPEKIQGWRAGAVWRNWFPKFTLSLDQDKDTTIASSTSAGKTSFSVGPEDKSVSLGFNFTWDFANFVWNPDQTSIDVRSRLMVQLRQDVLEEVTRLYFERRRLLSEFQRNPAADELLQAERSLRVEELTAQLDALTGSWFSKQCRHPEIS